MIRSMTGFGRASADADGIAVSVEVKTVNNRYLKLSTRLPDSLSDLELVLEKRVKKTLLRGTVNLSVRVGSGRSGSTEFRVNKDRLRQYISELKELAVEEGANVEIDLAQVARLTGVVESYDPAESAHDAVAAAAKQALEEALKACVASREEEGKGLAEELTSRSKTLLELNDKAKERVPSVVTDYRDRLKERINKLLEDREGLLKDEDLAREVAMFADRCDISEEIQRLDSHCTSMISLIETNDGEAGRRLDFMAQEMLREANTMGSKANDAELTGYVLEMKAEIEKIKEQIQNVE